MTLISDSGVRLDAKVEVSLDGELAVLVIESRGPKRNPDYIPAFSLALRRFADVNATLIDGVVASKRVESLPLENRRLHVPRQPYPVDLAQVSNVEDFSDALRSAAARIGRPTDRLTGGNPTKRLELRFTLPADQEWTFDRLQAWVLRGSSDTPPASPSSTSAGRSQTAPAGATYLLTWNPERYDWGALVEQLAEVDRGERPFASWSSGNTTSIPVGARVFLLRQGKPPRGVVASGWVIQASHAAPHWDAGRASGETAWYVGVAFEVLLPFDEGAPPLDVAAITGGPLADVYWAIPSSGTSLSATAARELETRWSAHLRELRLTPALGDGPELGALEGYVKERLVKHRYREWALRRAKLDAVKALSPDSRVMCEVPGCGFDFEAMYGPLGVGYAHVHHLIPLASVEEATITTLDDLAVVCANCHAMIHRGGECRSLEDLVAFPPDGSKPIRMRTEAAAQPR